MRSARLQAAGIAAAAVFVFQQASRMTRFWSDPGSPGVFPALVAATMLASAVSIWRQAPAEESEPLTIWAIVYALMIVAYGVLLKPLGYIWSSMAFLVVSFLWLRALPWWKAILAAGVAVGVTFVVFRHVFIVLLP